jgi:hypothetical protein
MKSFKIYSISTELNFGKFKGFSLKMILETQSNYINFCVLKLDHFCISNETLDDIKKIKPLFTLSQEEENVNSNKLKKWFAEETEYKNNKQQDGQSKYDFDYASHENDLMDLGYSEDYYNDDLDLDQQDEMFYNSFMEEEEDFSCYPANPIPHIVINVPNKDEIKKNLGFNFYDEPIFTVDNHFDRTMPIIAESPLGQPIYIFNEKVYINDNNLSSSIRIADNMEELLIFLNFLLNVFSLLDSDYILKLNL